MLGRDRSAEGARLWQSVSVTGQTCASGVSEEWAWLVCIVVLK